MYSILTGVSITRGLSLLFPVFISSSALAQSADDFWDECRSQATDECATILANNGNQVPAQATPRQCGDYIDAQCKLRTFNYCTAKKGGPAGCARYGVTPTFADFSANLSATGNGDLQAFSQRKENESDCPKGQRPQKASPPSTRTPTTQPPTRRAQQPVKQPSARSNPEATIPKDPDTAQGEADADIAQCRGTQGTANTCCNNPSQCGAGNQNLSGPAPGQSVGDYCKQMQALGNVSANANGGAAATCYTKQSTCSSMCADLAGKYEALANNCDSCASLSIYEETAQTLRSMKQSCDGLASRVQMLNSQALAANESGGSGNLCNQVTQAQPQSLGTQSADVNQAANSQTSSDPFGCQSNPAGSACQSCSQNPNSSACRALAQGQDNPRGSAGFQAADKASAHSPNHDDLNVFPTSYPDSNSPRGAATAGQVSNGSIPNNTGGGIPGSTNGSGLDGMSASRKTPTPSGGANTDILQDSTRSGGGYSYGGTDPNENQNFPVRSPSGGGKDSGFLGMDLKKLLPGWIANRLPTSLFGGGKKLAKRKTVTRYCLEGGVIGCDLKNEYPRTMGSFDGDLIPAEQDQTFSGTLFIASVLVFLGGFGSTLWIIAKWNVLKPVAVKVFGQFFFGPEIKKQSRRLERRTQNTPVQNNRRIS